MGMEWCIMNLYTVQKGCYYTVNQELLTTFLELYGGDPSDVRMFVSPGRVNLIGEHTDYNGGYVFPAALEQASHIIVRKTDSGKIRLAATDVPDRVKLDIETRSTLE